MSRRDRIRARLIYRQWGLLRQMRWIPPYGWITKKEALWRSYSAGASTFGGKLRDYQRQALTAIGVDLSSGPDMTVIAVREGDTFRSIFETMVPWRESDVVLPLDPTRYRK